MLLKLYSSERLDRLTPFVRLSLAWLIVWIISFAIDSLWNAGRGTVSTTAIDVLYGLSIELVFFLKAWMIVFTVYLLFARFPVQIILVVCQSMMIFISVLNLMLIIYSKTSLVYLGADLFHYSWEEITQTAGASGSLNLLNILLISIPLLSIPLLNLGLQKSGTIRSGIVIPFLAIACSTLLFSFGMKLLTTQPGTNKPVNKLEYFLADCSKPLYAEADDIDIYAPGYMEDDDELVSVVHYTDENQYPFLHESISENVLTPFFIKDESRPDIVLIIVEGLGRAFHNTDAYLGSFTPFLDSLSTKSLYWENFLSAGGRTFAVLPSVLGSLPFGQSGFLSITQPFPQHLSLLNVLKANGYKTSFYYGGDSRFDNMESYLSSQHIDAIIDQAAFNPSFEKQPTHNGFTWGYGDHELYSQYLEKRSQHKSPAFDVLLTLSMHSPFKVKDQHHYENLVRDRIKSLGLDIAQQEFDLNYVQQLATVMYSDHSLRIMFEKLRSDPRHQNTIYIITGDHRMPEIPMATKIDRYHVPLIVYSPKLNRPAKFSSVSSHFDLAPSLLSFLSNNYGIEVPGQVSWIGSGLDTARYFRNMHDIPLMQSKGSAVEYVSGNYHISGDELFQLPGSMREAARTDDVKKRLLQQRLHRFMQKNDQFVEDLRLYPGNKMVNR